MKYLITILAVLFLTTSFSFSQTITQGESFVDTDPGIGNGIPLSLTSADTVSASEILQTTGLAAGIHKLYTRFKDSSNQWSAKLSQSFYLWQIPSASDSMTLIQAECFFNSDPGLGNGIALSMTSADTVSLSGIIPLNGLSNGFHRFFVRYRSSNGTWSASLGWYLYLLPVPLSLPLKTLAYAEYFFDADPGLGNGIPLNMSPADSVTVAGLTSLSGFASGFHRFCVRYRDDSGKWGSVLSRNIFIVPQQAVPDTALYLNGAEYFVNYDPGHGYGVPLMPIDGVWDSPNETIIDSIAGIPIGNHWIGIRFRDNLNRWSNALIDSFSCGPILVIHISGSSAILDWHSSPSDKYFIYSSANSNGPYTVLDSTTTTSYTSTEILSDPASRKYFYVTQSDDNRSLFRIP